MRKAWLLTCAVGLVFAFSGRAYADPETEAAGLDMGTVSVENVDATVRMKQDEGEAKPDWKVDGVLNFYFTSNFANTSSYSAVNGGPKYSTMRMNKENNEFAVEVLQLKIAKKAENPGDWGFCAKLDLGNRAAAMGDLVFNPMFPNLGPDGLPGTGDEPNPQHTDLYIEEAWLQWNIPLGPKAATKNISLALKLGRLSSKLGNESLDVWNNKLYSLSFCKTMLPVSGVGMGLEFGWRPDNPKLNFNLAILNGNEMIGLVNSPTGTSSLTLGDNNNGLSLETSVSFEYKFGTGSLAPWIRAEMGLAWGPELAGNTADAMTVFDFIVEGGVSITKQRRKLAVALEFAMGRQELPVTGGLDWLAMTCTVSYEINARLDIALRLEYFEDHDGLFTLLYSAPGYAGGAFALGSGPSIFSMALAIKWKMTTDERLLGILEFRHDQSSSDGLVPAGGIFWDDDTALAAGDSQSTVTLAMVLKF